MTICLLCERSPAIKNSHIIPAFVCRTIKKESRTGYLRLDKFPNKRLQDSDKHPILCNKCEQRFGQREDKFNDYIFKDFRKSNNCNFEYGDWLHYFITSVTWRTLVMDIKMGGFPDQIFSKAKSAESRMREYLLSENYFSDSIKNHVIFFNDTGDTDDLDLSRAIPIIRKSVFGYTLSSNKFLSVMVNLAGILCITHINQNPKDVWFNTKVFPKRGKFKSPQKVNSWILGEFFNRVIKCHENMNKNLNQKQVKVIKNDMLIKQNVNSVYSLER